MLNSKGSALEPGGLTARIDHLGNRISIIIFGSCRDVQNSIIGENKPGSFEINKNKTGKILRQEI
jgi:hypothetical protein